MNNTTDLAKIMKAVARDEAEILAAKMGLTYDQLMKLRRHPDKAWARAEAKRLLDANKRNR